MKTGKNIKRYTVTSALPYANGPLHIGHLAGAYLPADIYVRYLRSKGEDVVYVCGTDEHGTAVKIQAIRENTTPQAIVDKYYEIIEAAFKKFRISFDVFSRTSKKIHHDTASEFFLKFYNEGKLIEKSSEQLFDVEKQIFLADRFVVGTCPKCGNENAYGNQCEKCGSDLSPEELINPRSKVSGTTPVLKKTSHWYLPLNDYQDFLSKYILEDHKEWKTNVYGQCKSWLQDGLQPRAITRDLDWGVKVPVEGAEGKVLYVWFDAPIGYISATKEWAQQTGKDWKLYWQDDESALIHFIGKDNIVFHCIIFPAILKGHGDYILPENVPANEFLNLEGEKISTSRGWAVWMHEFAEENPDWIDIMRYTLTAIMPETKDADFSWQEFQSRNNRELVDTFANFVNRVKVLTSKNFGTIPGRLASDSRDLELEKQVLEAFGRCGDAIAAYRFKDALNEMMNIARAGDLYLTEKEPWHLVKTDREAAGHVLNLGLNVAAVLAVAAEPFLPDTSEKIFNMLGMNPLKWTDIADLSLVNEGNEIKNIPHLFSRIQDEWVDAQVEKLKQKLADLTAVPSEPEPLKDPTSFDDFQGMDIRIGTILEAEKVPKSKKLLKLTIDIGLEKRTILSGVSEHFEPEELIGKQCTVLANLPPRKMMGIESNGMVLFAEDPQGKLHLLNPEHNISDGSTVN